MVNDEQKSLIREFLRDHSLAVISTFDTEKSRPEAALITYAENDNLELFFGTFQNERKYRNLQNNSHVAFVIGWDEKIHATLQYEGVAKVLQKDHYMEVRDTFLGKSNNINTEDFLYHPKFTFFVVTPTWIRYSSYKKFEMDLMS